MPNATKKASVLDDTMEFISKFDQPKLRIHNDNGKPAIGFGHNITSREIAEGKVGALPIRRVGKTSSNPFGLVIDGLVTQKAINQLFKADVQESLAAADNLFPGAKPHNMQVGLASFLYNKGINIASVESSHQLRAALATGSPAHIANAMQRFNKVENKETGKLEVSQGITNRLEAEASLVVTPDEDEPLEPQDALIGGLEAMMRVGFDTGQVVGGGLRDANIPTQSGTQTTEDVELPPLSSPSLGPAVPSTNNPSAPGVVRAIQGSGEAARVK